MSVRDSLRRFFDPVSTLQATSQLQTREASDAWISSHFFPNARSRPWRLASISDAMGVPAIQRCVTLISNTMGSLAIETFREGVRMPQTNRLLARPDPYRTPQAFYRDLGYLLASRGEYVLCIMSRDTDGFVSALVIVPPAELTVEDNPRNRLRPIYKWGNIESTRFSPATPEGRFVHVTYLQEPGELRGKGPLQIGKAAVSVSVEAQEWAANFYAEGGYPSILIKAAGTLGPVEVDGETVEEADIIRNQWMEKDHNTPRVVDDGIADVQEFKADPNGAQMLQGRDYQNGEAGRLFGISGALLDFSASGSSITYQNQGELFTNFVRGCLAPNYLEPTEQALTDLLPRNQIARFNIDGLQRADIKTRFDVYKTGLESGVYLDASEPRRIEGLDAGSIELAPVPFAPPGAVPASIPDLLGRTAPAVVAEQRCDGMVQKRYGGIARLAVCKRLLAKDGHPFVGRCPRCGKDYSAVA
jgi:HK97 family phage portal protein